VLTETESRTTPKSSPVKPKVGGVTLSSEPSSEPDYATEDEDEEYDDTDDSLLIPSYDSLICGSCVSSMPFLRRWAGSKGVRMIVKKKGTLSSVKSSPSKSVEFGGWEVIGEDVEEEEAPNGTESRKRSASPSDAETRHQASPA